MSSRIAGRRAFSRKTGRINPASSDAAQTITVASTQVNVPSMVSPSDTHSVTIRATSVAMSAELPTSAPTFLIAIWVTSGWITTSTAVKTTTSVMNAGPSIDMSSSTAAATMSPTALATM